MFKTLIVEDNATFRQSLKELLATRFPSMAVEDAGDGEEALQKIDALIPDIVFMDIKLPGENGLQVTKKIKTKYPEIIVIILTYYDLPKTGRLLVNVGLTISSQRAHQPRRLCN